MFSFCRCVCRPARVRAQMTLRRRVRTAYPLVTVTYQQAVDLNSNASV